MKHITETNNYDKKKENMIIYRALSYRNNDDIDYLSLSNDEKLKYLENKMIHQYWVEQDLHYLANTVRNLRKDVERLSYLLDDKEEKLLESYERTLSVLMELHGIEVDK